MSDNDAGGSEHREICDGKVKPIHDRDSGRHVVGWKCIKCRRHFGREQRVRDGVTFRYLLTDSDFGG